MKRLIHSPLRQKPNLIPCLFVIISCLPVPFILAADFASGMRAYEKGDYATALKEWRPLAEQGDARAQYNLGRVYEYGAQDFKEAVKWYRLAAEQGYASARYNLGVMFCEGPGVTQDYEEAT